MSPVIQDLKGSSMRQNFKGGYLPPKPDPRDYSPSHPKVKNVAQTLGLGIGTNLLPPSVDLRKWFTPVEDQLKLGSCTANAAVSIVEYFQKKAYGKYFNGSRLFVYKVTRKLMQKQDEWKDDEGKEPEGDFGADIRSTMGALAIFGVPDEKYWPYIDQMSKEDGKSTFDDEPSSFVYAMASRFTINVYFNHDPDAYNAEREEEKALRADRSARSAVLASVKKYLAAGIPAMFGFHVYESFKANNKNRIIIPQNKGKLRGDIPFPNPDEYERGKFDGHAVTAVGYDDGKIIKKSSSEEYTTGALLFRNSWGASWGQSGYGWLPYEYVLTGDATDFWSMVNMDWLDTDQFGIKFMKDENAPPVFGTFKVTVFDGIRIRSTPETSDSANIRKLGQDTKGKTYKYDKNTVKPVDSRLWAEVWNMEPEEYLGWMCVKEGNVQYTDTKF